MKRLKAFSIFVLSAAILCSCGAAQNAALQGGEDSVGAGLSVTMIPLKEDETFGSLRCCGDSVLLETDAEEIDAEETDDTETDGVETDDAETIFIQRYYYAKAGADFPEEAFCSFDYSQRYVYDFTAGEDGTAYFLLAETAEDPEEEDFRNTLCRIVWNVITCLDQNDLGPEETDSLLAQVEELLQVRIDRNAPLKNQLLELLDQLFALHTASAGEAGEVLTELLPGPGLDSL